MTSRAEGKPVAIVWFRDDLRTDDHPALRRAADAGFAVVPVFIHDKMTPDIRAIGAAQAWMLHQGLVALAGDLGRLGAPLVIRSGGAGEIIPELVRETGASAVFWNRRHGGGERALDASLKQELRAAGLTVESFNGNLLHEPSRITTGEGGPYRVYSPFWRAFVRSGEPRRPVDAPTRLGAGPEVASMKPEDLDLLPTKPDWAQGLRDTWKGGEQAARQRLNEFLKSGLTGYAEGRDFPGADHVSRLSPWLRFGMISPYRVWHSVRDADAPERDKEKYLKELGWREFSWHLFYHYPYLDWRNFDERFDSFPWQPRSRHLDAWRRGQTGYPIVDAGMRELWHTGYVHNRVRMIVASFLVKHLMVDWREGEKWFWDTLVDGDSANNPASWQWVAGCGADAAPFFRIFNPILQGEKFDPEGRYVRHWVPEIAALPDRYIHKPWEADSVTLRKAGIESGKTYPAPVVDHISARDNALQAFESLRKAS